MATYKDILNLIDKRVLSLEAIIERKDKEIEYLEEELRKKKSFEFNKTYELTQLEEALKMACGILTSIGYKPYDPSKSWLDQFYECVGLGWKIEKEEDD